MNKEQNVTFINKFANYIGLLIISICVTLGVFAITNTKNNDSLSNQFTSELFNINSSKVQQSFTDLGNINRNIPKDTKNEGICLRYPTYGTSLENITEEEKDNLIKESSLIFPGTNTYTSLDKDGNYLLDGNLTGKKIYKHTASIDMYEGNVSYEESARRYYLERLLLHEIGHYVNETLVRNKTARYKSENSADNYAFNMKIDI